MSTRTDTTPPDARGPSSGGRGALITIAWAWVLIPFLYGVYSLVLKLPALF